MPGPAEWDAALITAWTGAILGALGMVGGVVAWAVRTLRTLKADQLAQVTQMIELLTRADHQLHPNSGASLADKIDRIEVGQCRLADRVDRLAEDIDKSRKMDDQIRREIDAITVAARREHRSIWDAVTQAMDRLRIGEVDD